MHLAPSAFLAAARSHAPSRHDLLSWTGTALACGAAVAMLCYLVLVCSLR